MNAPVPAVAVKDGIAPKSLKPCRRCGGSGVYSWGAVINGVPSHSGPCFRCVGGGEFPTSHGRRAVRPGGWMARKVATQAAAEGLSTSRCGDCGARGEMTGHMTCQYPGAHLTPGRLVVNGQEIGWNL